MPRRRDGKGSDAQTDADLPIPDWPRASEQMIADWVAAHRPKPRRPLTVTIPLLTMICALDQTGSRFPVRSRVAARLKTTVDAIDAAISTCVAYGEIEEVTKTAKGGVSKHPSIIRHRYLVPNHGLKFAFNQGQGLARAAAARRA